MALQAWPRCKGKQTRSFWKRALNAEGWSCNGLINVQITYLRVFCLTVNLFWLESYIFGTSKKIHRSWIFVDFLDELHSRKLTWQWNIIHFDGIYPHEWLIFWGINYIVGKYTGLVRWESVIFVPDWVLRKIMESGPWVNWLSST